METSRTVTRGLSRMVLRAASGAGFSAARARPAARPAPNSREPSRAMGSFDEGDDMGRNIEGQGGGAKRPRGERAC
jgi:hypothetical protein